MSIVNLCTCFVAWICGGAQPGLALVVSVGNCSISAVTSFLISHGSRGSAKQVILEPKDHHGSHQVTE